MACAHPFIVYDKTTHSVIGSAPCGRCINCLTDWVNRYVDECQEELFQSDYIGSYVTVTYDRYHVPYTFDYQGNLSTTIVQSDYQKYVKRLRDYVNRKMPDDCVAAKKDFRYCVSAEYGESNYNLPRCHFHFIFFGLDWRFCRKMFWDCWKAGQVDVKPIKPGCFRYVVAYMHKQVKSYSKPKDLYECKNRARPFFHHSKGLGATLYKRFFDYAKDNNWSYPVKGKNRPYPLYIRRKFGLLSFGLTSQEKRSIYNQEFPNKPFSLKAYNSHLKNIARIRENNLTKLLRSKGQAVNDTEQLGLDPNYNYLKFFGSEITESPREFVSALKSYYAMSDSLYGHSSDWSFKGFENYFPSYHSEREIIHDVEKYGDLIPF